MEYKNNLAIYQDAEGTLNVERTHKDFLLVHNHKNNMPLLTI